MPLFLFNSVYSTAKAEWAIDVLKKELLSCLFGNVLVEFVKPCYSLWEWIEPFEVLCMLNIFLGEGNVGMVIIKSGEYHFFSVYFGVFFHVFKVGIIL